MIFAVSNYFYITGPNLRIYLFTNFVDTPARSSGTYALSMHMHKAKNNIRIYWGIVNDIQICVDC